MTKKRDDSTGIGKGQEKATGWFPRASQIGDNACCEKRGPEWYAAAVGGPKIKGQPPGRPFPRTQPRAWVGTPNPRARVRGVAKHQMPMSVGTPAKLGTMVALLTKTPLITDGALCGEAP